MICIDPTIAIACVHFVQPGHRSGSRTGTLIGNQAQEPHAGQASVQVKLSRQDIAIRRPRRPHPVAVAKGRAVVGRLDRRQRYLGHGSPGRRECRRNWASSIAANCRRPAPNSSTRLPGGIRPGHQLRPFVPTCLETAQIAPASVDLLWQRLCYRDSSDQGEGCHIDAHHFLCFTVSPEPAAPVRSWALPLLCTRLNEFNDLLIGGMT